MRILWLNPNLLLPLDKGGKLRTWHLLRQLAPRHDVTYLSFAAPETPRADLDGMREVCARLETVPRRDAGKDGLAFYWDVARHLADPLPYAVAKYRSRSFSSRLRHLLATSAFDLVVCDFLVPAVNLPGRLACPSVVFTHNVEAEIWRRHAESAAPGARRRLLGMQWRRMQQFERRTLARFDMILTVSDADRTTFARLYPEVMAPVHVVPTGVDVGYFTAADAPPDSERLVFTGSMDWIPNEDAMLHFARDIFPRVRVRVPRATLAIVGRAPTGAVRALARAEGIEVTGSVPDVRPWVAGAAVYVVPIRIGGGTRLKIFEAMAMGKAVVSTAVGAEGLPVRHGRDVLIADAPEAFAGAVVSLLLEPARRAALGQAARTLMVDRYDWSVVAGELDQALRVAAGRGQQRAGAMVQPPGSAAVVPAAPQAARSNR